VSKVKKPQVFQLLKEVVVLDDGDGIFQPKKDTVVAPPDWNKDPSTDSIDADDAQTSVTEGGNPSVAPLGPKDGASYLADLLQIKDASRVNLRAAAKYLSACEYLTTVGSKSYLDYSADLSMVPAKIKEAEDAAKEGHIPSTALDGIKQSYFSQENLDLKVERFFLSLQTDPSFVLSISAETYVDPLKSLRTYSEESGLAWNEGYDNAALLAETDALFKLDPEGGT
jgi:hypothetical protein